jgi:acetoin utilization deacetylase AcuC-like enzyme
MQNAPMESAVFTAADCDLHATDGHIEAVARRRSVLQHLADLGLLPAGLRTAPPVSDDDLARVHTERYIGLIAELARRGGGWLDGDTMVTPGSDQAARAASGCAVGAVRAALGDDRRAFALVRPPGHHALAQRGMGFCLYNHVAVAAVAALARPGVGRVLILDWDVHHGNGTQAIFDTDPRVCFVSLHQWPHYPGTGASDEIGQGDGRGTTINVPLPARVGDAGYQQVVHEVVAPVAARFEPDLILVSAGYDAHHDDPLGDMRLTAAGFGALTRQVLDLADDLCDGRVAFVLEGGYNLLALAASVAASVQACRGGSPANDQPVRHGGPTGDAERVGPVIEHVRRLHRLA